jgi:hypothetical protein
VWKGGDETTATEVARGVQRALGELDR